MNRLTWVVLFALAACDTKATASDPQSGAGRAEQKSREYESCGATLHCQENLRCFDNTCRRIARSAVGDYYAAVGAQSLRAGNTDAAIASYAQAINQYEAEKVAGGVPPDVDCAYGGALAAGKTKKQNAELAARVLHRCVLAVPAGSALRFRAFEQLATLEGTGLDPLLLGAGKTADVYLTKAAARPASDKIQVAVAASPEPKKSFAAIKEKLTSAELRGPLVACWEASKKDALSVTLGVKSSYIASEYEDEPGRFVVKLEAPSSVDAAETCVRAAVETVLTKETKMSDSYNTKLTITLK
jgi:hypothetical protein